MPVLINVSMKCDDCGTAQATTVNMSAPQFGSGIDRTPLEGWLLPPPGLYVAGARVFCPGCAPRHPVEDCLGPRA